jgi:hypothetical protein
MVKDVEIDRPSDANTPGGFRVVAIRATCDTCGDEREHRYTNAGPSAFQVICNTAESGLPSGYRVKCPSGHGQGFSVADISMKLP